MIGLAVAIARHHVHRADEQDAARSRREAMRDETPSIRPPMVEILLAATNTMRPDLVQVCASLGLTVRMLPLRSDVAGWIDHEGMRFVVNSDHPATRRRFTIAHQLGHWFYDRRALKDGGGTNDGLDYRSVLDAPFANPLITERDESAANAMAVQIVMPSDIVRGLARDGLAVREAADRLETTAAAMRFRYRSLGLPVE